MADRKQEVAEQLLALVPEELPPCAQHADRSTDAVCADCGKLCCWECVSYDLDSDAFRCWACREIVQQRRERQRRLRIFRTPFFYVALAVVFSVIAYAFGVGNPRPASLARKDKGKAWYNQELPHEWLKQALRVRQRLSMLEGEKGREAEYRHWAALARKTFNHMLESWGDTKLAPEIRMAAAVMRADAGEPKEALAELAALTPVLASGHEAHPALLYHQGKVCLNMDDHAGAEKYWNQFLSELTPEQERGMTTAEVVENMFGPYGDMKPEPLETAMVKRACRSDMHLIIVKNRIRELGKKKGLKLLPPKKRPSGDLWDAQDEEPEEAPAPAKPAETVPAKPTEGKPTGPLQIERFN